MASTNCSPLPSILKTSGISMLSKKLAHQNQVRFDARSTIDVATILMDYIEGRNDAKYRQLLNLKNDPTVNVSNREDQKSKDKLKEYILRDFNFLF